MFEKYRPPAWFQNAIELRKSPSVVQNIKEHVTTKKNIEAIGGERDVHDIHFDHYVGFKQVGRDVIQTKMPTQQYFQTGFRSDMEDCFVSPVQ